MKASELIKGSIFEYNEYDENKNKSIVVFDKIICTNDGLGYVFTHFKKTSPFVTLHLDKIKPIKLTKEWLLKFGFEHNDDFYSIGLIHIWYGVESSDFNYGNKNALYSIKTIKHVNQLQNLYFALTGKELTIKD